MSIGGWERTSGAGRPPGRPAPPRPRAPPPKPPPFAQREDARAPGRGVGGSHEHADAPDAGTPLTHRLLTTNL